MTFLSDRTRKYEHLLIGAVLGLALAAIAYHAPVANGTECSTEVDGYTRTRTEAGKPAEMVYRLTFEGRIERRGLLGRPVCRVLFKDIECATKGAAISCRPKLTGG